MSRGFSGYVPIFHVPVFRIVSLNFQGKGIKLLSGQRHGQFACNAAAAEIKYGP